MVGRDLGRRLRQPASAAGVVIVAPVFFTSDQIWLRWCSVAMVSLLAVTTTGCGSPDPASRADGPSSRASSSSVSPETTAATSVPTEQNWETIRDDIHAVSFEFPERVEPVSRTSTGSSDEVTFRVYQHQFDADVGLTVSISRREGVRLRSYARSKYDGLKQLFIDGGATDVRLSKIRAIKVPKGGAMDGTITWVAQDGTRVYDRMRIHVFGDEVLEVQALGGSTDAPPREFLDVAFERLVTTVDFD